jgi:dolichol-phosphate mannosyltransferase
MPLLLSVIQPVTDSPRDLQARISAVLATIRTLTPDSELIVSSAPDSAIQRVSEEAGARWVQAVARGFGPAMRAGLDAAAGDYVMTLDADAGHPEEVMRALWASRNRAELVVASRYVPGAAVRMSVPRALASRAMNRVFGRGLSLPVSDLSSAFRLYKSDVLREQRISAVDYNLLPELLVRAAAGGWRIYEVPLRAELSRRNRALGPLLRLLAAYVRTFAQLWQLRNSIGAGDYDARAHDSSIPLQRYWQRQRYKHITDLIAGQGAVLDVGCGSSRIIGALPPGSVALDILPNKLRFSRRYGKALVRGSGAALPFADGRFPCVLCSQVIEHVPMELPIISELLRTLAPGGRLVLGTPDYDRWEWVWMEKAYGFFKPGGYADEHISHYTYDGLMNYFTSLGYTHEETRYVLRGELILAFRKPRY